MLAEQYPGNVASAAVQISIKKKLVVIQKDKKNGPPSVQDS